MGNITRITVGPNTRLRLTGLARTTVIRILPAVEGDELGDVGGQGDEGDEGDGAAQLEGLR